MDYGGSPLSPNILDSFKKYVKFIGSVNSFLSDLINKFSGKSWLQADTLLNLL